MSRRWYLKIFIAFFLVILVTLVPTAWWLGSNLHDFLIKQKQEELKRELKLATNLISFYTSGDWGEKGKTQQLAVQVSRETGKRVTIIALNGQVLGDSAFPLETVEKMENHFNRPEILEAKAKGFGQSIRFSTTIQAKTFYGAVPVYYKGRWYGFLRMGVPMKQVEDMVSGLRRNLFFGAVLSVSLAILLGFILTWTVNRPLRDLTNMMKEMAEGRLKQPYHLLPKTEFKELSHSLEQMGRELEEKIELLALETTQLNAMLSAMKEGVLVTDEKGRVILLNPFLQQVLGGTVSWKRKTVQEIFMNSKLQDGIEAVLKGESFQRLQLVYGRSPQRHFEVQIVALSRPQRSRRAVALFHETTELQYLLKVRQDFVANASHELRTPLTSISGYVETLQSLAPEKPPEIRRFLSIIQQNVRQMNSLISDLLELARLDARETDRDRRKHVFVREVLVAASQMIQGPAELKKITFSTAWDPVPPDLKAYWDEERIVQALFNLLDNAVKYTPEEGKIHLTAEVVSAVELAVIPSGQEERQAERDPSASGQPQAAIQITVTDTGIGIPKEHLPRIFERFYRVDKARSREVGGTGLGLAIVKHIVESHGGTVQVASQVGKGSIFTVFLPLEYRVANI